MLRSLAVLITPKLMASLRCMGLWGYLHSMQNQGRLCPGTMSRFRHPKSIKLPPNMHFRLSYLPPLMVYLAAGVAGLTHIVGAFFVKEYLDLSAEALAAVAFWAGIPWTLKIPVGHLVDLIWRWKSWLVVLGALLITMSIAIMIGLVFEPELLLSRASTTTWFLLAALLAPLGYVLQDVVADAMTVEAVARVDARGVALPPAEIRQMHGPCRNKQGQTGAN